MHSNSPPYDAISAERSLRTILQTYLVRFDILNSMASTVPIRVGKTSNGRARYSAIALNDIGEQVNGVLRLRRVGAKPPSGLRIGTLEDGDSLYQRLYQ